MRDENIIVGAMAALVRNYADLPFDAATNGETAARVISRTAGALQEAGFALRLLREMNADQRQTLHEQGRLPRDQRAAAVLLPLEGSASVALAGTEHVTILSRRPGNALAEAVADCLTVEDCLSRRVSFAFDEQLGYQQAQPETLGTGLQAALVLHVPLLLRQNRLRDVMGELEAQGLRVSFTGMQGMRPRGELLTVGNRCSLGRTEQEICQQVLQGAEKLIRLEKELRQKEAEPSLKLADRISRAHGVAKHARLLGDVEFWFIWSDLRLGAQLQLLPLTVEQVDALLPEMMDGHLRSYAEEHLEGEALDECRSARVRELLYDIPLDNAEA